MINKCSLRVISMIHVHPGSGGFLMKREVSKKLNVSSGDEIVFILDKNGNINVRKHPSTVEEGEKYLDSATISDQTVEHMYPRYPGRKKDVKSRIPEYIVKILNLGEDRNILWGVDSNGNIIIKDTFISLNNNIPAMVISFGNMVRYGVFTIPSEIRGILDIYINDIVVFILDENDNIMVKRATTTVSPLLLGSSTVYANYDIIISHDDIRERLDESDKEDILWAIDANGNIIITSTCINT
jgi:bifunctional DNA-binding transcriptional regulator/antitoxin component of YhaV-PrlF toxin-antitoxin module